MSQEKDSPMKIDENLSNENHELRNEMLDYLSKSKAVFKLQHKDDPELSIEEKKSVATNLLEKNPSQFLSRFGHFLKKEHLSLFKNANDNYEISFHLKRLERKFQKTSKGKTRLQIDVKNRRFEAMKSLMEKGEYFSETEMMKRNPLLYDQLIGRYLTEEEKKARDNIDTQNITFVNLLMESIDRDIVRNFKRDQQDAEEEIDEEFDSDEERNFKQDQQDVEDEDVEEFDSDEDREEVENVTKNSKVERNKETSEEKKLNQKWGEMSGPKDLYETEKNERQKDLFWYQISSNEQQILRQEFVTNMYQSFLDGRDVDFDYSAVDNNEDYDNVELRTQDEEEKYFDSESPEIVVDKKQMEEDESEDELDAYMKTLKVK